MLPGELPPLAANNFVPSADAATATQFVMGTLFEVHVTPASMEV